MIDIKLLVNICNVKKYSADTVVLSEDDKEQDEMFILLVGNVKVYKNYKLPNEICLGEITPGNIFGEMNLFNKRSNAITVIAADDITVAAITRKNFHSLAKKNSDVLLQIMEMLCERVANVNDEIAMSNIEKTKIFNDYNIDANEFYKSLLFPREDYTYNVIRPAEYEKVLYNQSYTCPYCQNTFSGFIPLTSKLVLKGDLSCNMRRIYHDFDPLWYEIMTCPNCYFSAIESYFDSENKLDKKMFEDNLNLIKSKLELDFNEPKSIQQVFASYYLALICSSGYEKKKQIEAKIWLSLSWLYGDLKDYKMEKFAAQNAYEYTKIYYSECDLSLEAKQVALMILGTLARKLQNYDDAIFHLSSAITVNTGKTVYKRLIENEIYDIREERNKA